MSDDKGKAAAGIMRTNPGIRPEQMLSIMDAANEQLVKRLEPVIRRIFQEELAQPKKVK